MTTRLLATVFAVLVFAVLTGGAALAQDDQDETPKLGIRPVGTDDGYFTLEMEPGDERDLTVELGNFGSNAARARTYAADVYSRINGGFEVELDGEPISGATTWLDYPTETFELEGGEAVQRVITVEVPEDARSGKHLTSLVIQTAEPVAAGDNDSVTINQVIRQAIAVLILVPGPKEPALEIGEASYRQLPASSSIRVAVENTGNVRLAPTGELVVVDAAGDEVTRAEIDMDAVYAGTATFVEVGLIKPLPAGDYVASLSLADDDPEIAVAAERLPFTVASIDPAGTPVVPAVLAIDSVTVNEVRDADGDLQYVEGIVAIDNRGAPVANATLTLHVTRDGQPVEEVVLGSSLAFPGGPAEFRQRYFPADGWTAGTYAFAVTVAALDPNTSQTVELATATAETTVSVEP